MWRRESLRHGEPWAAKRIAHALSALLFALSILAQIAAPARAAAPGAGHWLCVKFVEKADKALDGDDRANGRNRTRLDHCEHCAIGQAPTLPAACSVSDEVVRVETGARSECGWTAPRGNEPTIAPPARAPPAFS